MFFLNYLSGSSVITRVLKQKRDAEEKVEDIAAEEFYLICWL